MGHITLGLVLLLGPAAIVVRVAAVRAARRRRRRSRTSVGHLPAAVRRLRDALLVPAAQGAAIHHLRRARFA